MIGDRLDPFLTWWILFQKRKQLSLRWTRSGERSSFLWREKKVDQRSQHTHKEHEQQASAGEPVILLRPTCATISAAENPMEKRQKVHQKTEIVEHSPGFLADGFADIKTQSNQCPGIETNLAKSNPEGLVIQGTEWDQKLHHSEVDVFVTQDDKRVEQGKS